MRNDGEFCFQIMINRLILREFIYTIFACAQRSLLRNYDLKPTQIQFKLIASSEMKKKERMEWNEKNGEHYHYYSIILPYTTYTYINYGHWEKQKLNKIFE